MDSFPLNIIDIRPLIKKVTHYSTIIMRNIIGVLHDMRYIIKNFALSLIKYIHVFIIVAMSLLGITLLFSKNKLGNLLILCYLFIIIFIFGLLAGIVALIVVCFEKTISLIKQFINLINMEKKISVESIINMIIVIASIFLFCLEFAIVLGFLTIMTLIVDFFFGLALRLFETINGMYSAASFAAQTATGALDSFGVMVRKGFENCG
jgi:hypothetical protein